MPQCVIIAPFSAYVQFFSALKASSTAQRMHVRWAVDMCPLGCGHMFAALWTMGLPRHTIGNTPLRGWFSATFQSKTEHPRKKVSSMSLTMRTKDAHNSYSISDFVHYSTLQKYE